MNSLSQSSKKTDGFTLLEVLISMVILMFISFSIYQLTTETFKLRDVLSREGDFYNGIRLSMDIVRRDVALMYSPIVFVPPKPSPSPGVLPPATDPKDLAVITSGDLGQLTDYWEPATDKTGIRFSRFIGTDNKMSFIAASHIRVYKDSPESEMAKISYELKRVTGNAEIPDGFVLYKTESPNAYETEDSRDRSRSTIPLLYGIQKFSYRYYRKDKDSWETSWDSNKEDFKHLFPDIIELNLEVAGPFKLSFEGKYRFRPEIPLSGITPSS